MIAMMAIVFSTLHILWEMLLFSTLSDWRGARERYTFSWSFNCASLETFNHLYILTILNDRCRASGLLQNILFWFMNILQNNISKLFLFCLQVPPETQQPRGGDGQAAAWGRGHVWAHSSRSRLLWESCYKREYLRSLIHFTWSRDPPEISNPKNRKCSK